jgi:hypothetical protein
MGLVSVEKCSFCLLLSNDVDMSGMVLLAVLTLLLSRTAISACEIAFRQALRVGEKEKDETARNERAYYI